MREIELAAKIINDVINHDISFKKAIKSVYSDADKTKIAISSSLAGSELRHHLFFEEYLKEQNVTLKNYELCLVLIALANKFFVKKCDNDSVINFVYKNIDKKNSELVKTILLKDSSLDELLAIEKNTIEYISIRFNTPRWLIKMWTKHYGRSTSFKILKSNLRPGKSFYALNSIKQIDELQDAQFVKLTDLDCYEYIGNGKSSNNELVTNNILYPTYPYLHEVIAKYLNPFINEFSVYSGSDDMLVREMYYHSAGKTGINLAVPTMNDRAELMHFIRVNKIKNINFFEAKEDIGFKAGISLKQDFILVNPISSSFNKIRVYPDYLLHFKNNNLDEFIKNQKSILNDLSNHVSEGGVMLYFVDTLNKKETTQVIADFLQNHSNFELVEEKQLLPFLKEDCIGYFAVLKAK